MKFTLLLTSVLSALSLLPSTHAWGQEGHQIVATIAEVYLQPNILPTLCSVLNDQNAANTCSLASVASWADQIRNKMKWSAPLHYANAVADHPPQLCLFPGAKGWEGRQDGNVLAAVRNTTDLLYQWVQQGSDPSDPVASEALKFLIHFVGDMHQPFHLAGRERGANEVHVHWGNKKANLHAVWDTQVVVRAVENTPSQWEKPLAPAVEEHLHGSPYDPLIRKVLVQGISQTWADEFDSWIHCPAANPSTSGGGDQIVFQPQWKPDETDDEFICPWNWATPIHQLTCDWVWPKQLDEPPYNENGGPLLQLDTEEYAGKITEEWVVEKLLAMAGVRLASIINLVFAQQGH